MEIIIFQLHFLTVNQSHISNNLKINQKIERIKKICLVLEKVQYKEGKAHSKYIHEFIQAIGFNKKNVQDRGGLGRQSLLY